MVMRSRGIPPPSKIDREMPHQVALPNDLCTDRSFTLRRQALQAAIVAAPENDRPKARLDLAKFYFANAMAAETLAVLGVIDRDSPSMGEDDPRPQRSPLTRMTFCFAWLFGLEPFLAGGTATQSSSEAESRL